MKVKVIKLDDRYNRSELEKQMIGKVYEALKFNDDYDTEYKEKYALGLENGVYFIPINCCEVIEQPAMANVAMEQEHRIPYTNRVLLVEDGSVDIDYIENELDIRCIIYRNGATPPRWLD